MDLGELPGFRLAVTGQYDGLYGGMTPEAARARAAALAPYLARVLAALDLPDEGSHLDLGCGDGLCALASARARPAMRVLGVDASERAVALARTLAREQGLCNATFATGDAEAPPAASHLRISALSVFNLLPDKRAALAAWRRVAAPDARLVVTDGFDMRGAGTLGAGAASPAGFERAARAAGWRIVHREDLAPLVAKLHVDKKWIWPEYVREGFRYRLEVLRAEK